LQTESIHTHDRIEIEQENEFTPLSYRSEKKPTWCAGCGGYGTLGALYRAISDLQIKPENLVIVSGIGCSSRLPEFVRAYGFHTIHGRLLPIATGMKLARPELEVLAIGGDGDGLAIGGNHFLHAARRNVDIAYIMIDNSVFGMTKGQPSPTTELGLVSKASPYGVMEQPVNPAALALTFGATYVARGFSANPNQLEDIIVQAIRHKGFAFVHVISPCVTYFNEYVQLRRKVTPLNHNRVNDKIEAIKLALDPEIIQLGILYKREEDTLDQKHSSLKAGSGEIKTRIRTILKEYFV